MILKNSNPKDIETNNDPSHFQIDNLNRNDILNGHFINTKNPFQKIKKNNLMERIYELFSKSAISSEDLIEKMMRKLMRTFEEQLQLKDFKILKLEQSLEYFYKKFIRAKKKLNLLSKNLFKIKNFEKNDSAEKQRHFIDKPFLSKKNSVNLSRKSKVNQDILKSIIGAKRYLNKHKMLKQMGIDSILSIHQTFDTSPKPSVYNEIRSFETEKNNYHGENSKIKKKRIHSPNYQNHVKGKPRKCQAMENNYLKLNKINKRDKMSQKKKIKKSQTQNFNKKKIKASTIKVCKNTQSEEEYEDKRSNKFADTNKKVYTFKKKKSKLSNASSKKQSKSKKRSQIGNHNKANVLIKNKKAKLKSENEYSRKTKKSNDLKNASKITKCKNLSRKQCFSVKTSSMKNKSTKQESQKKQNELMLQKANFSKSRNIKYSSSDHRLENIKNQMNEQNFLQLKTPGIGLEKLKISKYINILNKGKEKGSNKKKRLMKDLHPTSNLHRLEGKDKLIHLQNMILSKNSSSLKHLGNSFNNLHLNYIFSHKKNKKSENMNKFELNLLFPKKTSKHKKSKIVFKNQ
jgi:hypothetical protein